MYIKSYQCRRFAGLKDTSIEFDKGLNVILGPNESGKSTIIDGIHSTLFKNIRLKNNNNPDRDFAYRFMPKPNGSFIDGRLILKTADGKYEISKEWGSNENIELVTPSGNILKNEKDINEELSNLLSYGESTYSNIVFAKQRELNLALQNIISNHEVTKEINNVLRMALMELDGISIDSIQKNIEDEIKSLYDKWDIDKTYPQNNRGVNNPYKTGLGEIVKSFYNKESLRAAMEEADKAEKEFEIISSQIKDTKEEREVLAKEKTKLEEVEGDVNERSILDANIHTITKDLNRLMEVNKEWPRTEQLLEQLEEKLDSCIKEKEKLSQEKANLEKLSKKEALEKKLKRIQDIHSRVNELGEEIAKIPPIENHHIEDLSRLEGEIIRCETTMEAGKMIGILKKSGHKPIYIVKDFGEETSLDLNVEFEANGFIKIRYADEFEMEIKTGEIDFEELIKRHKSLKDKYESLLESLKTSSIEDAKSNLQIIKTKKDNKSRLEKELEIILDGKAVDEIKDELAELGDIRVYRDLNEIEAELKKNSGEEIDISANIKSSSNNLESWEKEYGNHDSLFDLVIEERSKLKNKEEELGKLKSLPDEFENSEEFKSRLAWLKNRVGQIQDSLDELNASYYEAKNKLSEDTYEELKKEYLDAEKDFKRNIHRGEKLMEIRKVFFETKERLASNPMESLTSEFARLLELITNGIYKRGEIDEDFNIKIQNPNGQIPIELLSAGTYDSVSLALRFSLLKHIFKDEGYVVLDDCLVDLDPERKSQSVDLIKELSKDYQIIFTTCDPQTAKMLGGNLIEL